MTDPFDFEPRLEARLQAHASGASRPFDAAAIATAAAGSRGRAWGGSLTGRRSGRGFSIAATLILVGLLIALLAAILLPGRMPDLLAFIAPVPSVSPSSTPDRTATPSTPQPSVPAPSPTPSMTPRATPGAPLPAGSRELLVVSDPRVPTGTWEAPCDNVDRIDPVTGAARKLITCADRVSISQDGSKAAVGGPHGVAIIEMRDGRQVDLIETGKPTYPIEWSPTGRWLEMNVCRYRDSRSAYGPCEVTIASTTDATQVVVPGGGGDAAGGYSPSVWMPDESHLFTPAGSTGWLIGDADGSNLVPLEDDSAQAVLMSGGDDYERRTGLSPDGTHVAYPFSGPTLGTPAIDLWVMSIDGTDKHALTSFEPDTELRAVAWSPDGTRLAFVKGPFRQPRLSQYADAMPTRPNELWLIAPDGFQHRIAVPSDLYAAFRYGTLPIRWSPDGSRLSIEAASGPVKNGAYPSSIDTIIVPIDGSAPAVLKDARQAQWSRDGRSIAVVHTTGAYDGVLNDPIPPATIDVANADGSDRHKVASPTGDPLGFWFIWAAP